MAGVSPHFRSLIAETSVAAMSAVTMYGALTICADQVGLTRHVSHLLGVALVFPFAFFVLTMKTMFPRAVPHRSYRLWAYVLLSQVIAATVVVVLLEAIGERWNQAGNIRDIVFYGLALGTPYGVVYAIFSKIFSKDVDTPERVV